MEQTAILIDAHDSVATVTRPVKCGETVCFLHSGAAVELPAAEDIPMYHKIAVRPLAAGEAVLKYGEYIGRAKCDIAPGAWVHTHNLA